MCCCSASMSDVACEVDLRDPMTEFTIPSAEGLAIDGNLDVPEGARSLVVIVHGFKGFKDWGFFPWLAERLRGERSAVCRFNMSRSGIGDRPESFDRLNLFADDTYTTQIDDLQRVVRHCQARLDLPTFLVGHSRGGGVALLAAPGVDHLGGVVTWSAIARADRWDEPAKAQWRRDGGMDIVNARTREVMRMSPRILDDYEAHREELDIPAAVSRLRQPILLLHGGRDESVPVEESLELARAGRDVSRVVIANAGHTYNAIHPLIHEPAELRLAATLTARFIGAYR